MNGEPLRIVLVHPVDGASSMVIPYTLAALQKCVGGYIEIFHFRWPGIELLHGYCNEDGIRLKLPLNMFSFMLGQRILGSFVIFKNGTGEQSGDSVSLAQGEAETICRRLNTLQT